ncbi:MAG: class I SAM-dependent methyltransferase [Actinomycetota bacterium]|nr:class I SAM-dependent methyltransferase [Actinomycetota bacterium]
MVDVGCGSGSRSAPHALARAIGVDIHFPSVAGVQRRRARLAGICGSLHSLPIGNGRVDAIVALDVIEHFVKEEAIALLNEFERVARRAIVLLTPNGFLPQPGTAENPFMEHRSGWSETDLTTLGYSVRGINGWRALRGPYAVPRFGPVGKVFSLASQPLARRHPGNAFHLLAVKHL